MRRIPRGSIEGRRNDAGHSGKTVVEHVRLVRCVGDLARGSQQVHERVGIHHGTMQPVHISPSKEANICFVYGDDYNTRDGSCIRDYVHVMDLADAHEKALSHVLEGKNESKYEIFNLGIGKGVSVLEAIKAFERTSGIKLNYEIGPRRLGDIVAIYADSSKAYKLLNWRPQYNIEDIMSTAWKWEIERTY